MLRNRISISILTLIIFPNCDLGIRPVPEAISTPTSVSSLSCNSAGTPFGGGTGTSTNPYVICTRTQLAAIAGAYLSNSFIQSADIDLGGLATPWSPIAVGFNGTYDGNSKTISNLYYNTAGVTDVGLFKTVTAGGVLKNIILTGVSITTTGARSGALVGRLTNATVQNCTSAGSVTGGAGATIGGLIGLAETSAIVTTSSSSATVAGNSTIGGLVGNFTTSASITSSYATGDVSGTTMVGGLVGSEVTATSITSSYATGTVTASGTYSGGLVGRLQNDSTITSSYATGNVTSSNSAVGGLVGAASGTGANNEIQSSYATGAVLSTNGASGTVGGLVGNCTNIGITSSYATGNATGYDSVGGLVGQMFATCVVTTSYATGNATGTKATFTYAGGLVGYLDSSTVSKSYATGSATGPQYIGGLAAFTFTSGSILNSYARGAVSGDPGGGLIGGATNITITNSYSTGSVVVGVLTGGMVGEDRGGNTVNTSYWDTVTSGHAASALGTARTTAQMIDFNNFVGWDFATIWNGAGFGGSAAIYPYLR